MSDRAVLGLSVALSVAAITMVVGRSASRGMTTPGFCCTSNSTADAQSTATAPDELVFVADDVATTMSGCDSINAFRVDSPAPVHLGRTHSSPDRMAATTDMSLVLATYVKRVGALYALYRDATVSSGWADTVVSVPDREITFLGDIAITPDDRYVLLATQEGIEECPEAVRDGYFYVSKYALADLDLARGTLGRELGRVALRGPAAEIVVVDQGRTAHIVSVPFLDRAGLLDSPEVVSIDVASMTEIDEPINLASIASEQHGCGTTFRPLGVTHATTSPDERFLVTNRWDESGLNVVDLRDRKAWSVDSDSRRGSWTGGVSFSKGTSNHGLLAIHGVDHVSVVDFGTGHVITEVLSVRVPPTVEQEGTFLYGQAGGEGGPSSSLEWSWSGEELIAAISVRGSVEFRSWRVDADRREMTAIADLEGCTDPENMQTDVLTGNGIVPTPSLTSTPTSLPTGSPTPTPTRTSSEPSPSPTLTLTPTHAVTGPMYLPLLLREEPCTRLSEADVMLVLDTSSSMLEEVPTKLSRAEDAIAMFLGGLPSEARAGLVTFHTEATVVHELTADHASVAAALARSESAPGTRMDRGIRVAAAELARDTTIPKRTGVLVLLTDGEPSGVSPAEVIREGDLAKGNGVQVFTIGLGADVNQPLLIGLASQPNWYYEVPSADDLRAIYGAILREMPCEPSVYWGGR